jgi:hypothetical protein
MKKCQLSDPVYEDGNPEFNFTMMIAYLVIFVIVLAFECMNKLLYLKRSPLNETRTLFDANRCLRRSSDSVLRAVLLYHSS